jgi:hypothetical protein
MISLNTQIIGKLSGNRVLVAKKQNPDDPNSNEQKIIDRLKNRDREVRVHEMSHGTNPELIKIGSAQFDYTIGPDGKAYATGGKVTLSTGSARTPEDALAKAGALKKASMAPGEPSSQDFQALNAAVSMELEAENQIYSNNNRISNQSRSLLKGTYLNMYA